MCILNPKFHAQITSALPLTFKLSLTSFFFADITELMAGRDQHKMLSKYPK